MHKYTYLLVNAAFFIPGILVFILIYKKTLTKSWRFIFLSGFIGALYFFTVDILATSLKDWQYNYATTIGVRFHFAVLEELIWMILVFMFVGGAIEVYFCNNK